MVYKNIYAIALFVSTGLTGAAQIQDNATLQKVIPASPAAASLGKYGEVPVATYTGLPNISVPIYEVTAGRITIPVALTYHAGGVRIEETASWVGLGWSCSPGGAIIRTVRGLADEGLHSVSGDGYFKTNGGVNIKQLLDGPSVQTQDSINWYRQEIGHRLNKAKDGEPDAFYLTAPGLSGNFFYNQELSKFLTNPKQNLKIDMTLNQGLQSWSITDETGLVYTFATREVNTVQDYYGNIQQYISYPTGWYLSTIYDPLTNETVTFAYDTLTIQHVSGVSEVDYFPLGTSASFTDGVIYSHSNISTHRLKRIVFSGGQVDFNASTLFREDVLTDKALANITVYNNQGKVIRKAVFHTSYLTSSDAAPSSLDNYQQYSKRLRLDSLAVTGILGANGQLYKFAYNATSLPQRLSFSRDHWGYYNGKGNSTLLPSARFILASQLITLPGANREADSASIQACVLNKITWPTGGHTEFFYENNSITPYPSGDTVDQEKEVHIEGQDGNGSPVSNAELPFTVNSVDGGCYIAGMVSGINTTDYDMGDFSMNCYVVGTDPGNSSYALNFNYSSEASLLVPNGNYKLVTNFSTVSTGIYEESYTYVRYDTGVYIPPSVNQKLVGGLRIKSIKDHDPVSGSTYERRYFYHLESDTLVSSGFLPSEPAYSYLVKKRTADPQGPFVLCYKRTSYSHVPLATTKGSAVGYGCVTEMRIAGQQRAGKTTYEYVTMNDELEQTNQFPFWPTTSMEYRTGFLTRQKVYASVGGAFTKVNATENSYRELPTNDVVKSYGFNGGWQISGDGYPCEVDGEEYWSAAYDPLMGVYKELSDVTLLAKKTDTTYAPGGSQSLFKSAETEYNFKNLKPYKTTESSSISSEQRIIKQYYPIDYPTVSGADAFGNGIQALIDANIVAAPVETATFKHTSGQNYLTAAVLLKYHGDRLLPEKVYRAELATPTVTFDTARVTSGSFVYDSKYKEAKQVSYTSTGRIATQQLIDNVKQSFLWDSIYPIAEALNAAADQIAYTSFESANAGNWVVTSAVRDTVNAITGYKSYNLSSASITSTVTNGTAYSISYWSRNGSYPISGATVNESITGRTVNGWTHHEHKVTATSTSITVSGSGIIDELRLYPKGALMSTYTYTPLVGITSQCDINNRIAYYEYDDLGRLETIRDQDRNVVKLLEYRNASEPTPMAGISSTNSSGLSGFTAVYTNTLTSQQFTFTIPASGGLQTLGAIPAGTYNLTISKPQNNIAISFYSGCGTWVFGTSASFSNLSVSSAGCNSIALEGL